jgi:ribosomal protein S18 acetylase RimI-like enzyme
VTVVLRKARPNDVERLLPLIHEHAEYERAAATINETQLTDILEMDDAPTDIIVAEANDMLVGFAAITIDFSLWRAHPWGHLDCLFVNDSYRGLGIGQQLLQHAASLATQKGADQLEWQTPEWNSAAVSFYRRQDVVEAMKVRFCHKLSH